MPLPDRIEIKDLKVRTIIGINDVEREQPQTVVVNITLETDTRVPGRTDKIVHAVNYRTVAKQVIEMVERSEFFLVEKLAEEIAALCLADQRVERARVSVEKPGSVRFARSAAVTIDRSCSLTGPESNRAHLVLGSNIRPRENLPAAVAALRLYGEVVSVSQVWETPPADLSEEPNYLNAAVLLETPLTAHELCRDVIPRIERSLKRVRDPKDKNASRTIDIDVSFFNREILTIDHRKIPDPDVLERPFLTIPLAELDPDFVHPECGRTLAQITRELKARSPSMQLAEGLVLR